MRTLLKYSIYLISMMLPLAALAETGVSDSEIVLGQSAALSGPAAALGTEMRSGAQLYFDQVNSAGGIHGRKIRLLSVDDGYEPERAAANTRKLIEQDKVFSLFGYVGTPTSLAALPIFSDAKVPFFAPFTGAQALREPFNRNIFNIRASYFDETEKIVELLYTMNTKRVAVLYQNDSYGKAGLTGIERALAKRNGKIAVSATVERNSVDVAAAVKTIHGSAPDAVVMISAYTSVAAFVKAMKSTGSSARLITISFVGSQALADALGDDSWGVVISQVVPLPWSASVPIVREYQTLKKPANNYSFTELEGYLAARIFVEGLKRAGRALTREKLIAALEQLNSVDVGGVRINFSEKNHSGSDFVEVVIVGKGKKFIR